MKDFFEFRASVNERMDRHSGASGHSDGQNDSNTDRKKQDKDYSNMIDHNDGDIKRIDSRGNITYK